MFLGKHVQEMGLRKLCANVTWLAQALSVGRAREQGVAIAREGVQPLELRSTAQNWRRTTLRGRAVITGIQISYCRFARASRGLNPEHHIITIGSWAGCSLVLFVS